MSRKKTLWEGVKEDFLEQFQGFPPQIQTVGKKIYQRSDPIYKRVRYEVAARRGKGKEDLVNVVKTNLKKVPFQTPYTGANAFQPKPPPKPKGPPTGFRKLLSPKTYQTPGMPTDGSIPEYLKPKKKEKKVKK